MPTAELQLPVRLLAGGGPSSPDPRVLRALATPLVGQFDPAFTLIMDDVVQLGRETFLTASPHCFAISALAAGGLEAVVNSLVERDHRVALGGSPGFVAGTAEIVRRCGATPVPLDDAEFAIAVVPFVDPFTCQILPISDVAKHTHERGGRLVVDATLGLAANELRVDDWEIDVCVAGADYAIGAPSGMSLVTYSPAVQDQMLARATPPTTSYLDLLQLKAYWSPERLNHHTAPTSLVYGLREALRLVQIEGLTASWARHASTGGRLRAGLETLGLQISGDLPYSVVHLNAAVDEGHVRRVLRDEYGVHVSLLAPHTWRVGLLGADARGDRVNGTLAAVQMALAA